MLNPGAQMGLLSYVNMIVTFSLVLPTIAVGVLSLRGQIEVIPHGI
jgi:hypothetical protein